MLKSQANVAPRPSQSRSQTRSQIPKNRAKYGPQSAPKLF